MRGSVLRDLQSSLRTPLLRNSAFILATALLGYGIGFLFWLLVARLYDPSTVGLSATLLSTILFLATLATLGFPFGLIRFLPEEKDRIGLINTALTAVGIASLVVGLVFVLGIDVLAPTLSAFVGGPLLAAMCVLSIAGFAIAAVLDALFQAARRAEYGMIRNAISNIARLPLVPVLGALVFGVLGVALSWTVAIALSVGVATWFLLPRLYPRFRVAFALRHIRNAGLLRFSVWNHASVVIGAAASSLLPLIILSAGSPAGGASQAAYFYAAFTVASILYIVPASFTTSLFVEGSYSERSDPAQVGRTLWVSMGLLVLGIIVITLLGPWILSSFGEGYAQAGYGTLVLLSLASPVILLNAILVTDLRVRKRVRTLLAITALSTALSLSVAYIAIPSLGILGAAVGFVLAHVVAIPMLVLYRRQRPGLAAPSGGKV